MRPAEVKQPRRTKKDDFYNRSIKQHVESPQRVQSRRMVLLSLKKPTKPLEKITLKQLFTQQRRPSFSFSNRNLTLTSPKEQEQCGKAFESNIRNLISKSIPHVSVQTKQETVIQKKTHRNFRINKQIKAKITRKAQLQAIKKDYISMSQKIDIMVKEKNILRKKQGIKSRRNKVTFYMNNFVKTKYPRPRKNSEEDIKNKQPQLRQTTEISQFIPWEKSFEIEQEDFVST